MEKKISKKVWFSAGRIHGFGVGFSFSVYNVNIDLGFWYVSLEF